MKTNYLILSIFSIIIIASCHSNLYSQKVCAAEILKVNYFPVEHRLLVDMYVCREQISKDSLIFDWGDGHIDTLLRYATGGGGAGHVIDYYGANHFYDTTINRYVLLSILDEEVEEGFVNVDYTVNTSFSLSDSIFIYNVESGPQLGGPTNEGPTGDILGLENYGYPSPEIWMYMMDGPIFELGDSLIYSIGSFPVEGYMPPAPEDEFYMDGGLMIWNTPMIPGKYAVACKIREMTRATNPIYEEDKILFSTITRAFTIIVDSSDIVSTIGVPEEIVVVSVYPNPAQNLLQVEYGGIIGSIQLQISNARGQQMYDKRLESFTRLQSHGVDISNWSTGTYFIQISNKKGRVVKKIQVE